jgi:hypothetical protein
MGSEGSIGRAFANFRTSAEATKQRQCKETSSTSADFSYMEHVGQGIAIITLSNANADDYRTDWKHS